MNHFQAFFIVLFSFFIFVGAGCEAMEEDQPFYDLPGGNDNTTTNTDPVVSSLEPVSISEPNIGSIVQSPIQIRGTIPGNWATEGQILITLERKKDDVVLGDTVAMIDQWMTEEAVPFEAELAYISLDQDEAVLVIHKGNPSGLPQNEEHVSLPITVVTSTSSIVFDTWHRVSLKEFGLTMQVPEMFSSSSVQEGFQFQYAGPTQRGATELYDGISITVNSFDGDASEAELAAQEQYEKDNSSGVTESISSSVRPTPVGENIEAYTYEYTSIANIQRYFFEADHNSVIMLSVVNPDPEDRGYEEVVEVILREIKIQ